ncbi:MAG: thiamine pyrophosphate-binding protein [Proteobacteria bacterium]|nr:thiamine pyrophosphate-binding protein [Pseudomonadota bacterium]
MNTADVLVDFLVKNGVKYIFGIPGGAIEDLNTSIFKNKKITPIVTKHEAGAAYIADGFARVANRLGVCFATAGPGASNLITALATAYVDGIPVMALTGQVATSLFGRGAFQESGDEGINIVNIFKNFTKYSTMILNEKRARYMIGQAIRTALTSPFGPVHISLPVDIMKKEVEGSYQESLQFDTRYFDQERVATIATILSMAKNPLIIAGWGCALSRAACELRELSELLKIPVATSPKGKGVFPESHPYSLGVFGFAGSPAARDYIHQNDLDVVLAVGTSFNEFMSSGWDKRLCPQGHLIHIDVNPEKIGKNFFTSMGVPGDARTVISQITRELETGFKNEKYRKPVLDDTREMKIRSFKEQYAFEYQRETPKEGAYHPKNLIMDVQDAFPYDTIYFSEIGTVMAWTIRHMVVDEPYTYFVPLGFGGMGYATAAPIGGKLAIGDRAVVAFVGDGSFLMHGFEVATAVNYNIPAIWIVLNNAMHGMIYHGRKMFKEPVPEGIPSKFKRVNFALIAEGMGARGIQIQNDGEITREWVKKMKILESKRPVVIDVIIDEEAVPPIGSRIETVIRHFTN